MTLSLVDATSVAQYQAIDTISDSLVVFLKLLPIAGFFQSYNFLGCESFLRAYLSTDYFSSCSEDSCEYTAR
jgi:hypothetical protein